MTLAATIAMVARAGQRTKKVIFLMTDGARWQDAFRGADEELSPSCASPAYAPKKLPI